MPGVQVRVNGISDAGLMLQPHVTDRTLRKHQKIVSQERLLGNSGRKGGHGGLAQLDGLPGSSLLPCLL